MLVEVLLWCLALKTPTMRPCTEDLWLTARDVELDSSVELLTQPPLLLAPSIKELLALKIPGVEVDSGDTVPKELLEATRLVRLVLINACCVLLATIAPDLPSLLTRLYLLLHLLATTLH